MMANYLPDLLDHVKYGRQWFVVYFGKIDANCEGAE